MNTLPAHRRAIEGRTHSRTYYPADYDPIEGYHGGGGTGWRLFVAALGVVAYLGAFAAVGLLLAWRG